MGVVNIHAARSHLSRLVEQAAAGEETVIAKAGRPITRLVALTPARPRRILGALGSRLVIPDDLDRPLPDDFLASFEAV